MPVLTDLPRLKVTRRSLIAAALGLGTGAAAAGGLAAAEALLPSPALTIIGQDAAQFTLLRADGARIGLLFGAPMKNLLSAIRPLLGWTSPRLDVLVISPVALNAASMAWLSSTTNLRSLLVLGPIAPSQMPAMRRGIDARVLTEQSSVSLGRETRLDLLPSFSTAVVPGATGSAPAMALVRHGAQTVALIDDAAALQQQPWRGRPSLLVTPGGELRPVVATMRPAAIAINGRESRTDQVIPTDLGLESDPVAVLRTFLSDPALIELRHDELRLPRWTTIIGPDDGS